MLQLFYGAYALPRGRNLDKHSIARCTRGLVERNQTLCVIDRPLRVERQTRIGLGGHATRHQLQNFVAHGHRQSVSCASQLATCPAHLTWRRRARGSRCKRRNCQRLETLC